MPGAPTTRFAIPLPAGGDDVAVPADVRRVAERVDALGAIDDQGTFADLPAATPARRGMYWFAAERDVLLRCTGTRWVAFHAAPQVVSSLPSVSAAFDGLTVDFLPAPSDRTIVWRVRYDSGLPLARRWVVVGSATPIGRTNVGAVSWGSASYAGFTSGQQVPVAGFYEIEGGCYTYAQSFGITCLSETNGAFSDGKAINWVNPGGESISSRRFEPVDMSQGGTAYFGQRAGNEGQVVRTDNYWVRYHPRALAAT